MRKVLTLACVALALGAALGGCTTMQQIEALPSVASDPNISPENKVAIQHCAQQRASSGLLGIVSPLASIAATTAANKSDDCTIADKEWEKRQQRKAYAKAN